MNLSNKTKVKCYMEFKLAYLGEPVLRLRAAEVVEITPEIHALIDGMFKMLRKTNGLGIAAPQLGHSLRIFIIEPPVVNEEDDQWDKGELEVFINPKIISYSEETWVHSEGCLSIPKVYGDVSRPTSITVEATGADGQIFTKSYTGWPARVIMHENDHLNGVLFIDRMDQRERKKLEPQLKEIKKKYTKK